MDFIDFESRIKFRELIGLYPMHLNAIGAGVPNVIRIFIITFSGRELKGQNLINVRDVGSYHRSELEDQHPCSMN